jgi:hypothetical protein
LMIWIWYLWAIQIRRKLYMALVFLPGLRDLISLPSFRVRQGFPSLLILEKLVRS